MEEPWIQKYLVKVEIEIKSFARIRAANKDEQNF